MDDRQDTPPPASPSAHSTTPPSPSLAVRSRPTTEHADTPLRKKPRLNPNSIPIDLSLPDHMDTDHPSSSPHRQPNGSRQNGSQPHSDAPLSRSLDSSASSPPTNGRSDPPRQSSSLQGGFQEEGLSSPETVETIEAESSQNGRDPPVVEIKLDDEAGGDHDHLIDVVAHASSESQLINDFPLLRDGEDPVLGLKYCCSALENGEARLELEALRNLKLWLQRWLDYSGDQPSRWQQLYGQHPDFWTQFVILFTKLITKGCNFPGLPSEGPHLITQFLILYIRISAHFIRLDLHSLSHSLEHITKVQDIRCFRFLRNISALLQPDDFSFWALLREKYRVDPVPLKFQIGHALVHSYPEVLADILAILGRFSEHVNHRFIVNGVLKPGFSSLNGLLQSFQKFFTSCSEQSRSCYLPDPEFEDYARKVLDSSRTIERNLRAAIESEKSILISDTYKELINSFSDIVLLAAVVNPEASAAILRNDCKQPDLRLEIDHTLPQRWPGLYRLDLKFRLLWACILKGRMELRVFGVFNLGHELVELWENTRHHADPLLDSVVRYMAKLLAHVQVVEYIVSADSHPQLISRASNILGYSIVTHNWTESMSDAVWRAIEAGQDQRIVPAVIECMTRSITLSSAEDAIHFCRKSIDLPLRVFDPVMMGFVETLFHHVRSNLSQEDENGIWPYKLCIRLISDSLADSSARLMENDRIYHNSVVLLHTVTLERPNSSFRQSLYLDCVKDVEHGSGTATGSLASIKALFETQREEDFDFLMRKLDILDVIGNSICSLMEDAKARGVCSTTIRALDIHMSFLMDLLTMDPASRLDPELERNIWSYAFGERAPDNQCRNASATVLRRLLRSCGKPNRFADRCIKEFLPSMNVSLFPEAMVPLVQQSMEYLGRLTPISSPKEDQVISDPLGGLLWEVTMNCQDEQVAQHAIVLLSKSLVDRNLFLRAPLSSVAASQRAVLERSILQLKNSARVITEQSNDATIQAHPEDAQDSSLLLEHQRFVRILAFLRQILSFARDCPEYQHSSRETKSPSLEAVPHDKANGDDFTVLKYEAHGKSQNREIRELTIERDANFETLSARLTQLTGFPDMFLIVGGQKYYPKLDRTRSISEIVGKGLVIVSQPQGGGIQTSHAPKPARNSVPDTVVLSHFDIFYDFLDLDPLLSYHVYEFLGLFPPRTDLQMSLTVEETDFSEFFPPGKVYKSLYTLRALQSILGEQMRARAVDGALVLSGARFLLSAITDEKVNILAGTEHDDRSVELAVLECLDVFLKHISSEDKVTLQFDEVRLVNQIYGLFRSLKQDSSADPSSIICKAYEVVIELCAGNSRFLAEFQKREAALGLHQWIVLYHENPRLREHIISIIDGFTRSMLTISTSTHGAIDFYWSIVCAMIRDSARNTGNATQLLSLAITLYSRNKPLKMNESLSLECVTEWIETLLSHDHVEVPGQERVDEFTLGLSRLINACLGSVENIQRLHDSPNLVDRIFDKFLYPPITTDTSRRTITPVLFSETRKELFQLVSMLCKDAACFETVVAKTANLFDESMEDDRLPVVRDPSRMLRSSAGYVGLTNLTNTCYMNSLITQLYMTPRFRHFMQAVKVADPSNRQKLLAETQGLFNVMERTTHKCANTDKFVSSIVPYDGPSIDVSIQMDVDEFCNLMFDRWEGQIESKVDRDTLKSIFGGEVITQIKSQDCDHVSERPEPFLALSCEVKGKYGLSESLRAYVQGDVMEGDNKYKCESCNGRLVNAVKRSCLRNIPDNLMLQLKRFDFDLTTYQRNKINDKFEFPPFIDMAAYSYDHLNNPEKPLEEDVFDLVGVLVHNGTAEAGHYYSYIRLRKTNEGHFPLWVEFNDADVTAFDSNKIPETCFGGPWDPQPTQMGYNFMKPWNAYMLFYQRRSSVEQDEISMSHEPKKAVVSTSSHPKMDRENQLLARWYCLSDSSHARFVQDMLLKLKLFNKNGCSPNHSSEAPVLAHAFDYIHQVATRTKDVPDLDLTLQVLRDTVNGCAECHTEILQLLLLDNQSLGDMLLRTPIQKTRQHTQELIIDLVRFIRSKEVNSYGVDTSSEDPKQLVAFDGHGLLPQLMTSLKNQLPRIGRFARVWDEYFILWRELILTGLQEAAVALSLDIFSPVLEIFLLIDPALTAFLLSKENEENAKSIPRAKRSASPLQLVHLIAAFLKYLDTSKLDSRRWTLRAMDYTSATGKFPLAAEDGALMMHTERHSNHFLTKVIDSWENQVEPYSAGYVVKELLKDSPENNRAFRIRSTLIQSLNDYYINQLAVPLDMTIYFCRFCQDLQEVSLMIREISMCIRGLDREPRGQGTLNESKDTGCLALVDFLKELSCLDGGKTLSVDPQTHMPFRQLVIDHMHIFGPPLLLHENRRTREAAMEFLDKLVVLNFPAEDEAGPRESDVMNYKRVRDLFDQCIHSLTAVRQMRHSRNIEDQICRVIQNCFEWVEKVNEFKHQVRFYEGLSDGNEDYYFKKLSMFEEMENSSFEMEAEDGIETQSEQASEFDDMESAVSDDETAVAQ